MLRALSVFFFSLWTGFGQSYALKQLEEIESYIQDNPSQAYSVLSSFDRSNLCSKHEKGLYYLLLSTALDKNFIDIKSDSIIKPAIIYYSNSKDRYHQFLSFYYQGRVFENAEQYDKALESYFNAEKAADKTVSAEYLSRLFSRKGRVYYHQFALDRALSEVDKAKAVSLTIKDQRFYVGCCFDEIALLIAKRDFSSAAERMKVLDKWVDNNGYNKDAYFYETKLGAIYVAYPDSLTLISSLLDNYLESCSKEDIEVDHLMLAGVYAKTGRFSESNAELKHSTIETLFQKAEYYGILYSINKGLGDYNKAFEAIEEYQTAREAIHLSIFNNDVRFLEERYESAIKEQHTRVIRCILTVVILLMLAGSVIIIIISTKHIKEYRDQLEDAKQEYGFLKDVMSQGKQPEDIESTMSARLQSLRPFVWNASWLPTTESRSELAKLEESRKEMLRNIGFMYAMSYPKFVSELSSKGLSAEEIGLCSMYLSKYSTKELIEGPHSGRLYRLNTTIRSKLNLPANSIKLSTWLRNLFNSTGYSDNHSSY